MNHPETLFAEEVEEVIAGEDGPEETLFLRWVVKKGTKVSCLGLVWTATTQLRSRKTSPSIVCLCVGGVGVECCEE